jgi:hypothetical protein
VEGRGNLNGADTNEVGTVREAWKGIPVQNFSNSSKLEAWGKNWPNGDGRPAAKIIYDPAAGKVRVFGVPEGSFSKEPFFWRKMIWR